ncbi:ISSod1, transposase OrfA [Paraglaciecola psychrophila 170]|uniref:ISSod1, transposase OrfA n=1 Tax=Paraglaciecola psychrophila 170 TaxID=1129794 RepID=M4RZG8_9ALTE|nr:ISSod1, transposase OrfA [Paraglaciecola psychrophila 170]
MRYLKTGEGWQYLAIVMDSFGRRIVGWSTSKRITTCLIEQTFLKAHHLRQPPKGLVFHSDIWSKHSR